jgi:glutamate-1-semialdehyde aminotransferase/acyl carrier protein
LEPAPERDREPVRAMPAEPDTDRRTNHEENTVDRLLQEVVTIVGGYFDIRPDHLDPDVSFVEIGADSMSLLGMLRLLEDRYGCKVALRQLFNDVQTPSALAGYLAANAPAANLPAALPAAPRSAAVGADTTTTPAAGPVGSASIGGAPMTPAVGSPGTGVSAAVESLLKEQLLVMQRQLELLAGGGPIAAVSPAAEPLRDVQAPAPPPAVRPAPPTSAPPTSAPPRPAPPTSAAPLAPGARGHAVSPLETAQRARYLKALADRFGARTKSSKEFTQRFRPMVADSRSAIGFRPPIKEMLYPIVAERGQGARLWDIDDNEYVDLAMGYGVHLLGHNPPVVMSALRERVERGFSIGPRTRLIEDVAAGILELTGMERVAFLNTGTEAVMTALRLARVATGRDKVVVFSTAYHGHSDGVLAVPSHENGVFGTKPLAPGVSPGAVQDVYVLEFGTDEALDFIDEHGSELAAVMTEPVTLRTPGVQNPGFLRKLREITLAHGTKLIFDEMVTGFRCHPAGVQGLYGIEADLATYGKIIGGGLPLGVIAGRGGIMDTVDGGVWNFGDDSGPTVESTFFAGTFNQHPLSMVAAKAVLDHLHAQGPGLQRELDRKTEVFVDQLNTDFRDLDMPIEVRRFSSLFRFEHDVNMDPFYFNLLDRGVFVWELRNFFLSTAHEQADLDHIRAAIRESVTELRGNGMLGEDRTSPPRTLPHPALLQSTLAQRQLVALDEGGQPAYQTAIGFWLDGALDRTALGTAVQDLVARHESLRTTLGDDGETLVVDPPARTASADVLTEYTSTSEEDLGRFLQSWAGQPLDLIGGPVFRAAAVQVEPRRHLLLISVHHAAVDGWSFSAMLGDLVAMYNAACRGTSPVLPPVAQFRDYLAWHHRTAAGATAAAHRDYWHSRLKGAPALELPASHRAGPYPFRAVRHSVVLDADFRARMREAAYEQGVTEFAYLVAAWGAVLHRLSGQDDVVVPVASARRPQELDEVVGYCTNLLPLRLQLLTDASVTDYVSDVLDQLVTGLENQDHPFAELVAELAPDGAGLRNDLLATSISFYRQVAVPAMDGLAVSEADPMPITHTGHLLALNIVEGVDGFRCDFEIAADVIDPDLVERVPQYYRNLLGAMIVDGDQPMAGLDHREEGYQDGGHAAVDEPAGS